MVLRSIHSGLLLALLSGLILVTSCTSNRNGSNLPRSIGNTSEVLVVLQNQEQWDGPVGQTIRKYMEQEQYGMPQVEPLFKLSHVTVSNFSDLFKKHRNLLIVEIDPTLDKSSIEVLTDLWASPQRIFNIKCPSNSDFSELFAENEELIIQNIGEAERQRIMEVFNPTIKNDVSEQVLKTFNLRLGVPSGFYVAKSMDGFMWLRKEVPDYSQGIFIISEPYQAEAQFSTASITARTNRELQKNVPGSSEGSFMIIDTTFLPPKALQITNYPFEYAIETRGMWNVANDFMGGPFVSYTFTDKGNQRIITLVGYVYYPNHTKRDLMRQMEAILYSVSPAKE
jgi:hypothetical protein